MCARCIKNQQPLFDRLLFITLFFHFLSKFFEVVLSVTGLRFFCSLSFSAALSFSFAILFFFSSARCFCCSLSSFNCLAVSLRKYSSSLAAAFSSKISLFRPSPLLRRLSEYVLELYDG